MEPPRSHLILLSTRNRERVYSLIVNGVVELSLLSVYLVSGISLPLPAGKNPPINFFSCVNTCRLRTTQITSFCLF